MKKWIQSKILQAFQTHDGSDPKNIQEWQQKIVMWFASQLRPISPAPLWYQPHVNDSSDRFISGIAKRHHLWQKIKPEFSTILTYWFTPIVVRQVCRVSTFLRKDVQKHSYIAKFLGMITVWCFINAQISAEIPSVFNRNLTHFACLTHCRAGAKAAILCTLDFPSANSGFRAASKQHWSQVKFALRFQTKWAGITDTTSGWQFPITIRTIVLTSGHQSPRSN